MTWTPDLTMMFRWSNVCKYGKIGTKKSREDVCKLSNPSEKFKFASVRRLHGDRAEMALNKQFGPRYCGQKYLVYKGEMAFAFKYPICFPKTKVTDTKWCL